MSKLELTDAEKHELLDGEISRLQSLGVTATFTGGSLATLSVSDKVQLIRDMRLVLDNEEYLRQKDGR